MVWESANQQRKINLEATHHMKFFWEQQMKLLQSGKMGRRYNTQIIRFALSLHAKLASAYRELQKSGALILPSERVLRDYKNYFKPKAGINKENVENLKDKISSFSNVQRYVALVMDEMKIQSKLVFNKVSGELIGFIDLGDPMTNYANLQQEDTIASHALAFLVRGLRTDLKHVIGYYFTGNITSFLLIFLRIISVLEVSLNLWVVAAVNDVASPNKKFSHLHCNLTGEPKHDLVYKTQYLCNVTLYLLLCRFATPDKNNQELPLQFWIWFMQPLYVEQWKVFVVSTYSKLVLQ